VESRLEAGYVRVDEKRKLEMQEWVVKQGKDLTYAELEQKHGSGR
jgi:hypothetical protein